MKANLIEVSNELRIFDFENKKCWNESDLNNIKSGLYLLVMDNTGGFEIRDKNKSSKTGLVGKIIVPKNSISIKFGKFEQGFLVRMQGYYKHLHRPPEFDLSIFQSVLNKCYCLDLSMMERIQPNFNPAAIYESFWNRSLHFHFLERGLLAPNQNMRSEYREIDCDEEIYQDKLVDRNFMTNISKSIDESFLTLSKIFNPKEM